MISSCSTRKTQAIESGGKPLMSTRPTAELLASQAELIRKSQPVDVVMPKNARLTFTAPKSYEQIKSENYDLRHKKSFMRVLQMHSVMPADLQKATEPSKCFVKDYGINVEERVRKVVADFRAKNKNTSDNSSDSSSSSGYGREPHDFFGLPTTSDTKGRSKGGQNSSNHGLSHQKSKLAPNSRMVGSTASHLAKGGLFKKRLRVSSAVSECFSLNELAKYEKANAKSIGASKRTFVNVSNPRGAQVVIDNEAKRQIKALEEQNPVQGSLNQLLKQAMMKKIDDHAAKEMRMLRRRMSVIRYQGRFEEQQDLKQAFDKAYETKERTHQMVKNRPHDKVQIVSKPKDGNKNVSKTRQQNALKGGGNFVKMSFEQLPPDLQAQIQPAASGPEGSYSTIDERTRSGDSSSGHFRSSNASSRMLRSSVNRHGNKRPVTSVQNKFDQKSNANSKTNDKYISYYNPKQDGPANSYASTAETAALLHRASINGKLKMRKGKQAPNNQSISSLNTTDEAGQQARENTKSLNMNSVYHRKNDSLFNVTVNRKLNSSQLNQKTPYTNAESLKGSTESIMKMRQSNGSISNVSESQYDNLTQRFNKRILNQSQISPLRRKLSSDKQVPVKVADDCYMVYERFMYDQPQYYQIQFARPAIYATGCLTCGNESAKVENYGERYCCTNCQKTLQTPGGDTVTLRTSHCGRFIVAQAWKYSKLLKGLKIDIDDLRIRGGHKCHATFAGEKGDIIVLLDEIDEAFVYS